MKATLYIIVLNVALLVEVSYGLCATAPAAQTSVDQCNEMIFNSCCTEAGGIPSVNKIGRLCAPQPGTIMSPETAAALQKCNDAGNKFCDELNKAAYSKTKALDAPSAKSAY